MGLVRGARQPAFAGKDGTPELKSEVLFSASKSACASETAEQLLGSFCEDVPATRVAPTDEELDAVWARCTKLQPLMIARAIAGVLASAISAHVWQPQLRALRVTEHLHIKGGQLGRTVARLVMGEAHGLVRHIVAEVPECFVAASRVLELWELGEAVTVSSDAVASSPSRCASNAAPRNVAATTSVARKELRPPEPAHSASASSSSPAPAKPSADKAPSPVEQTQVSVFQQPAPPCDDLICLSGDSTSSSNVLSKTAKVVSLGSASPHVLDLDPSLIEALLATTTPDRFDIGGGESVVEDSELNRMFSFNTAAHQVPLFDPEVPEEPVPIQDPFAFVAEHMATATVAI